MPRTNSRSRKDRSDWGVIEMARERPIAAAAAAASAAAAGLFLWSKRNQISQQINNLSDQIGDWTDSMTAKSGTSSRTDDRPELKTRRANMRSGTGSRLESSTGTAGTRRRRSTSGKARGTIKSAGAGALHGTETSGQASDNS